MASNNITPIRNHRRRRSRRLDLWKINPAHTPYKPAAHESLIPKEAVSYKVVLTGDGVSVVTEHPSTPKPDPAPPGSPILGSTSNIDDHLDPDTTQDSESRRDSDLVICSESASPVLRQTTKHVYIKGDFRSLSRHHGANQKLSLQAWGYADCSSYTQSQLKRISYGYALQSLSIMGRNVIRAPAGTSSTTNKTNNPWKIRLKVAAQHLSPNDTTVPDHYLEYSIRVPVDRTFRLRILSPWNESYLDMKEDARLTLRLDRSTGMLWGEFNLLNQWGLLLIEDTEMLYDWIATLPPLLACTWLSRNVDNKALCKGRGSFEISASQGIKGVFYGLFESWDVQFFSEKVNYGWSGVDWENWVTDWDNLIVEFERSGRSD